MSWRLAESLKKLREQINDLYPERSKVSDGSIGDAAHASRSSDHNPWVKDGKTGVVTAIDITHHLESGVDCNELAKALVASRDERIKYLIWNKQMVSSYISRGVPAWTWRPYSGSNAHRHHLHISVASEKALYDSRDDWDIEDFLQAATAKQRDGEIAAPPPAPFTEPPTKETEVTVIDGNIEVKTSEGEKPKEKIAIEKPPSKQFAKEIRNDIAAVTGGNVGVQTIREAAEGANFLGLSPRFWLWVSVIAVVSAIIYLAMKFFKHREEVKRDLEITKQLMAENSTENNQVVLVDAEKLEEYKQRGYKVITR